MGAGFEDDEIEMQESESGEYVKDAGADSAAVAESENCESMGVVETLVVLLLVNQ